jgi:3-oxoacyl-[acyl-carrier-protein] synthase III
VIAASIEGLGMHAPERVVTNEELAPRLGTTAEWIEERTGIRSRRFAPEGVATSELALPAARRALDMAQATPADVDLILFATLSPDHHFPGAGCYFQAQMGMEGTPVLDIRNQCSGFLYGLAVANAMIGSGAARSVLLVGAEVHSHALDLSPRGRDVAALFGDGAGAALLRAADGAASGIRSVHLHADGRFADALCQKIWDIRKSPYIQHEGQVGVVAPEHLWASMKGQDVFRWAVRRMVESIAEACAYNRISPTDLDLVVPHQANRRINECVMDALGIPREKCVHTIEEYGNTTAASIPMAMTVALERGRLERGARVMLAAFGAGFTWASAYLVF